MTCLQQTPEPPSASQFTRHFNDRQKRRGSSLASSMANRYNEVSGALGIRVNLGIPSANAVDNCNGCVDCENNTWLASSRSTLSIEMGRETSPGCGGEISFLHRDRCTPARLSDELHAYGSPNEVVYTSVQAAKNGEQISCGTAPDTSPTTVVEHFDCEAVLQKATMEQDGHQVTAEKCRQAEESQEMVVTAGAFRRSLNGKHLFAEINFVRPKRDKIHREIPMLTEGGRHGKREDYTVPLEDCGSTTASSSRRSSGLSQVEGTTKCLEELVGHGEEELAEQHLRFERLQSFCEVVADEDYEFISFGCTLEVPASRNSNADVEAWRHCWGTMPADLPEVRRTSLTRPSKLHCAPCNNGAFIVAPSDTMGVHALDVFDEKTVAGNLRLLRESTEKLIKTVGITTKCDTSPAFTGVHDTVTLVMGAADSSVTGLEEFSTLAEGPNCIACGRSMSCNRCYPKTAVSALLRRHNSISQPLANIRISSGTLHACGADSDKHDQFLVDEGDSKKIGCLLSGGACGRCASNIYCLTCLEHMQEQTAGLRALAEEGDLQATDGHQPNERRESVEFASLLALTATLPHPLFTNSISGGRQESLQVAIRPQRLPEAAHCERTFPALFSAETGTRLGCKSVGIHEMAELYRLRARDNCAAINDRTTGTLRGINITCRGTRGRGNVRQVSPSDFGESDQTASPPFVSGCVHSLRVEITRDTTENTWSAPVCGIKHIQWAEGDLEKQKYVAPVYPSLSALKRKASQWEARTDSSAETIQSMNSTNVEDASQLVYGRTCVLEVTSCAQHKESSSINYAKAGEGEHECMKVRSRQKVLTQRGLKRKNVVEYSGPARDLQRWEESDSSGKCCSAGSSGQALRALGHHGAYFFTQGRCSLSCTREKSRRVSLSLSEKQDNTCREPCSAAARFSLVRQQRVEGAFLMQRSAHADAYATAEAVESCSGLSDQAPTSALVDSVNSFQGPRSKECSHQPHRVAPRKCTVTFSSAAAHQQIEVRTRVSNSPYRKAAEFRDRFSWQPDTRPLQLCSRCVTCTRSSSLHFSPTVHDAVIYGNLSKRGTDLTVHDWEVGLPGRVAAGSESKPSSSACTAGEGRSTTVAVSKRTSETVSLSASDGKESQILHKQGDPAPMQQGRERECHMIENDTQQPQAVEAANRHRLEVSARVLPAFTTRQGEQLTCSWSARLTTATVSIGSSISTTSQESSYDRSTGSTPLCYSRGEQSETGVSDSAPQDATHAAWTVGRRTSGVQERNDKGSRHYLLPPPIVLHCQHEPDLAPQPLSAPLGSLQAASKRHSRQSDGMYSLDTFEVASDTSAKKCDVKFSNVGTEALQPSAVHAVAFEHAVPSSGTLDVGAWRPLSPYTPCVTSCYVEGEHRAWKRAAQTARSGPGWEVQGYEKRSRIGHCASQQETQKTEKQARFGEQLIDNWISWREETALHWCMPATGAVCRPPRFSKMPDSLSAGILHPRPKTLGTDKPAAVLPLIDISPFSSPSCYSDALAFSVETIQTDKGNPLCPVASERYYAPEPAEVWKECSTPESNRTATTVSPHSSRQLRSKKRKIKAHRRDSTVNECTKPTAIEKQTVTVIPDYEKGRGKQAEEQKPGQFIKKEETVTLSTAVDALQNPYSMKRTGKAAPTGENVTDTSYQGTFLEFGKRRSSDNDFEGVKASRMAGAGTRPLCKNHVVERGESVSGDGSLSDVTPSTADADAGGIVRSDASLSEPYDVRKESRRRALPEKGIQMKAREARPTRMVCRTRDKSVFSGEGTKKSWRTGADGKVLYDACGHKISGVWYDNGRRLWRVVFTQGERRRTKGFSLKQYGFEQARNLAVQCKLAIEARKALREEETA